jgi:hypothetical protein
LEYHAAQEIISTKGNLLQNLQKIIFLNPGERKVIVFLASLLATRRACGKFLAKSFKKKDAAHEAAINADMDGLGAKNYETRDRY